MRHLIGSVSKGIQTLLAAAALAVTMRVTQTVGAAELPPRFILTGHEGMSVGSLPLQHITRVVKIPAREAHAPLFTFYTAYSGFFPDQMRSWRLRILDGKLAGHTFQISSNGPDSITVTDLYGPLESIAVGDMVMVESVVERYIPER